MPKFRVVLITQNIQPPHIYTVDNWTYLDFEQAIGQEATFTVPGPNRQDEIVLTLTKVLEETQYMAIVLCHETWSTSIAAKLHRFW